MTQDYERKGGIHSKVNSKEFEENFDKIFRQPVQLELPLEDTEKEKIDDNSTA